MGMGNSSKQAYKAKIGQVLLYLIILYHISKQHSEQVQALKDLYLTFLKPCGGLTPCLQGKFYRSPIGSFRNQRGDFPVGSIKL